jgi:MYXO-CTERM domain-containing protein
LAPTPMGMHVGDVVQGWIELTNSGTKAWTAGVTKLAPVPRDVRSPFADSSWLSPTRVSTVMADVPVGQKGQFPVALKATALGDFEVTFGLVEEAVTWFSDAPLGGGPADGFLRVHVTVLPAGEVLDAGFAPVDGGGQEPGGGGDGNHETTSKASGSPGSSGCGCRVAGPVRGGGSVATSLVLAGLALARRKRRANRRLPI